MNTTTLNPISYFSEICLFAIILLIFLPNNSFAQNNYAPKLTKIKRLATLKAMKEQQAKYGERSRSKRTENNTPIPLNLGVDQRLQQKLTLESHGRRTTFYNVALNNGKLFTQLTINETFTLSFGYKHSGEQSISACHECNIFTYIGIGGTKVAAQPENKANNHFSNAFSLGYWQANEKGKYEIELKAPEKEGFYYITFNTSIGFWAYQQEVQFSNRKHNAIALIKVSKPKNQKNKKLFINDTNRQIDVTVLVREDNSIRRHAGEQKISIPKYESLELEYGDAQNTKINGIRIEYNLKGFDCRMQKTIQKEGSKFDQLLNEYEKIVISNLGIIDVKGVE